MDQQHPRDDVELGSWKEIANYLAKSVRTAQRWERCYGLPVHRIPGSHDVIFALRSEIDEWKRRGGASEAARTPAALVGASDRVPGATGATASVWSRCTSRPAILRVLLAILLCVFVASAAFLARRAAGNVEESLVGWPIPLTWEVFGAWTPLFPKEMEKRVNRGFVDIGAGSLLFRYVKTELTSTNSLHPCASASAGRPLESPVLRLTFVMATHGRISHKVGFKSSDPLVGGFGYKWSEPPPSLLPQEGVALELGRSNRHYTNSILLLHQFRGGRHWQLANHRLPFQLEPNHRYSCSLTVEGHDVVATVSDGRIIQHLTARLQEPLPILTGVFISDGQGGPILSSPPGTYVTRFDDIVLYDAVHPIAMQATWLPSQPASETARCSVAVLSSPNVSATDLSYESVQINGRPATGCRAVNDANGDGLRDLVCDFDLGSPAAGPIELVLEGKTSFGRRVRGSTTLAAPPSPDSLHSR